jgi:hypothetical protein
METTLNKPNYWLPRDKRKAPTKTEFKRWLNEHMEVRPDERAKYLSGTTHPDAKNFGYWLDQKHRQVFLDLYAKLLKNPRVWTEIRG